MRKYRAFTLIELLVVVAIISVLVAILLPSLGKARDQAKRSVCATNMRQMGATLKIYFSEYRKYPEQATSNGTATTDEGLARLYKRDYIKTPKTYWCPSDQGNLSAPLSLVTNEANKDNSAQISYVYMYYMYWTSDKGFFLNSVYSGEGFLTLMEDWYGGSRAYSKWGNHTPEGGNVLFLDGHAEWKTSAQPWDPAHPTYTNGYKAQGSYARVIE